MESRSHRSQAVGRTRCRRKDFHVGGKGLVVDVVNDSREVIAGRSRNNDFLCACFQVRRSFIFAGIEACALEDDVNFMFAPRNFFRVFDSIDDDLFAVDDDGVLFSLNSVFAFADLAAETALRGVILEKVSEHLRAGKIVYCHDLITLCVEHLTERKTTDTTETIDSNFNSH